MGQPQLQTVQQFRRDDAVEEARHLLVVLPKMPREDTAVEVGQPLRHGRIFLAFED